MNKKMLVNLGLMVAAGVITKLIIDSMENSKLKVKEIEK